MFRKERESENIKERRKIYAARNFSDKYDFALFKYPIKFIKLFIRSLKILIALTPSYASLCKGILIFVSQPLKYQSF
jgi:hypothetical protein